MQRAKGPSWLRTPWFVSRSRADSLVRRGREGGPPYAQDGGEFGITADGALALPRSDLRRLMRARSIKRHGALLAIPAQSDRRRCASKQQASRPFSGLAALSHRPWSASAVRPTSSKTRSFRVRYEELSLLRGYRG